MRAKTRKAKREQSRAKREREEVSSAQGEKPPSYIGEARHYGRVKKKGNARVNNTTIHGM